MYAEIKTVTSQVVTVSMTKDEAIGLINKLAAFDANTIAGQLEDLRLWLKKAIQ